MSIRGNVLDREKFDAMREEYYQLRGWDKETGLQKKETLIKLGMGDVAGDLEEKGLVR